MLSIDFLGHATIVVKTESCSVIFDPHLHGSYRHGLFGYEPPRDIDSEKVSQSVDAIVVSHSHRDHFDIPSLKHFPRDLPVFVANDKRLQYGVSQLGFSEVFVVSDWAQFRLGADLDITVTPSSYRVPEHGFLMRCGGVSVWNIVDSHVEVPWCERVSCLAEGSLDYALVPAQPLVEGNATSAIAPHARKHRVLEAMQIIEAAKPAYAIPFADGHLCIDRIEWLNRHWMPLSEEEKLDIMRRANHNCQILDINAGDLLQIENSTGVPGHRVSKSKLVEWVGARVRPRFEPGYSMDPAAAGDSSFRTDWYPACQALHDESLLARVSARLAKYRLRSVPANYEIQLVNEESYSVHTQCYSWDGHTLSASLVDDRPTIEVIIGAWEFVELFASRIEYSAILIGGLIREAVFGFEGRNQPFVFRSVADVADFEITQPILFSGIFLLGQLLVSERQRSVIEIDRIISNEQVASCGRTRRDAIWKQKIDLEFPSHELDAWILDAIHTNIQSEIPFSKWTRSYQLDGESIFLAFPDGGTWEPPAAVRCVVVPLNLVGPQSTFGSGVGASRELGKRLRQNISKLDKIDVSLGFLNGRSIPCWRLPDLFPVESLIDTRLNRGFLDSGNRWWLGYPPPDAGRNAERITVYTSSGKTLWGIVNAESISDKYFDKEAMFLARLPADSTDLFSALLNGTVRVSWILTEDKWGTVGVNNWEEATYLCSEVVSKCITRITSYPAIAPKLGRAN